MKSLLRDQQGGSMIIVIGLVMGAILLSFVFFDMFTVLMNKRVSQTSADAAVLGAVQEMKEIYESRLREKIEEELIDLGDRIEAEVQRIIAELLDAIDEENPEPPEIDPEAIRQQVMNSMGIPSAIQCRFTHPKCPLNASVALEYFFGHETTTRLACQAIRERWSRVEQVAQYYATTNGAKDEIELTFPYNNQFAVFASVKTEASFTTVDDSSFAAGARDVTASAAAQVTYPQGLTYIHSACQ